jgi:glucosamine-6-phosphate deaminase
VLVYGIGRMCHIAFWEPHFADEYETEEAWLAEPCRIGARLHPFTIEQNAITSFRSSWPLIPCYANTIGPKIIFGSDYAIGGADGVLSRGMQWQGMSFWMTIRYGPTKAVTSSRIPTMPGKLFFMQELAGPLCADTN